MTDPPSNHYIALLCLLYPACQPAVEPVDIEDLLGQISAATATARASATAKATTCRLLGPLHAHLHARSSSLKSEYLLPDLSVLLPRNSTWYTYRPGCA
ncbi:hypothetical protein B0T11DRAFT_289387 [Plectosphaerella cucumerina]|uniref:Uncharacterized protein n=1 Tax=Plectosphaerella cucumerina TaxID=40658 RepID=A0A8K0T7S9_9PEZI|nr:hypothetical protein B0T11DRAFT_289387 [Plectosphaerella cucumerina]